MRKLKLKFCPYLVLMTVFSLSLCLWTEVSLSSPPDKNCSSLVKPKRVRGKATIPFAPTDAQILEIWRRLEPVTPLNPRAIRLHSSNPKAEKIIEEILGFPYGVAKIYNYAIKIKPYKEWIIQAGLDPDLVFKKVKAIEPELIIKALRALIEANYNVQSGIVNQGFLDDDPKVMEIIYSAIQRRIEPSHLHYYATGTYNKTWDQWLLEAGQDPAKVTTYMPVLNEEELTRVLIALKIAGVQNFSKEFKYAEFDSPLKKVIFETLGREFELRKLAYAMSEIEPGLASAWSTKIDIRLNGIVTSCLNSEVQNLSDEDRLILIGLKEYFFEAEQLFYVQRAAKELTAAYQTPIEASAITKALKACQAFDQFLE